jgi:SAM-dependent methyltransferase
VECGSSLPPRSITGNRAYHDAAPAVPLVRLPRRDLDPGRCPRGCCRGERGPGAALRKDRDAGDETVLRAGSDRALDLGCGTGTHAVFLATRGWEVIAIDNVERALKRARDRAAARGVSINWLNSDVSRLAGAGLTPGFALVFDRGCFHGLADRQRDAYAAAVTDLVTPGATLLMWAMAPNRRPLEPAGADGAEIEARFRGWEPAPSGAPDAPASVGASAPGWHRLTRR